jgi:hypothetical protein
MIRIICDVIPAEATDLGFNLPEIGNFNSPSRQQPTWMAESWNPYSRTVVTGSGFATSWRPGMTTFMESLV